MEGYVAGLVDGEVDSALDAAQDLIFDAWEAPTRRQRIALARRALKLSPLCADAYVLLAEETARSASAALDIYRKGVEAGELALGKGVFGHDVGRFWGLLETRPYMRARSGLAQALWDLGEREEAVAHYRDMLRLNPNDNQGNRYLLAACYVEMERHDALDQLLEDYGGDPTAAWVYTRALAAFHREGDTCRSRDLLTAAIKSNSHVPAYLLGWRTPPRRQDDYIQIGGESEAAEYAREFAAGWARTSGALVWLGDSIEDAVR